MEEIWKPIKDYEGLYEISNLGRVKSLKRNKILKLRNNNGYLEITLHKDKKAKTFLVHRLVALHFVDGYFEGAEVDHINTNKEDNIWTNLKWVTKKENMNNKLTKKQLSNAHKGKQSPQKGKTLSEEHKKKISESHKGKKYKKKVA